MSQVTLRLPNSLHQRAKELASQDDISLNTMITIALAEKLSALDNLATLKNRAKQGEKLSFAEAFTEVPNVEADDFDKIP